MTESLNNEKRVLEAVEQRANDIVSKRMAASEALNEKQARENERLAAKMTLLEESVSRRSIEDATGKSGLGRNSHVARKVC